MAIRYGDRRILFNDLEMYKEQRKERGISVGVEQYSSPNLRHLTAEEHGRITAVPHIWGIGDRFYKLAFEAYGDAELWWVIAWFNKKPTEAHVSLGETIEVPHPLNDILNYMGI
tara:strand:- start:649 stop:990 length:342 start_codon:yes stop_codon:yes gene_type:complete